MTEGQWLHSSPFNFTKKKKKNKFHFHMRHTLVLSISTLHWLSNKHDGKSTRECKNSKMFIRKCKIRKCISLQNVLYDILPYEIYSPLLLNRTVQQNSQHCTKLHNKVYNVLHNKIYWKIEFSLCFGFVNQVNVYILNCLFKLLVETFH